MNSFANLYLFRVNLSSNLEFSNSFERRPEIEERSVCTAVVMTEDGKLDPSAIEEYER